MGEMRNTSKIALKGKDLQMCTNVIQDRVQWQACANVVIEFLYGKFLGQLNEYWPLKDIFFIKLIGLLHHF